MAQVWLHRTTKQVLRSVAPADLPEPAGNYIEEPDLSAVAGTRREYWAITGDIVTPMSQAERDAVDAAELLAANIEIESILSEELDGAGRPENIRIRALIELFNKRDNYLINRIIELQDTLTAIKATSGGTANIRAAIPGSWSATATRTKAAAITDYRDDVEAGNQR